MRQSVRYSDYFRIFVHVSSVSAFTSRCLCRRRITVNKFCPGGFTSCFRVLYNAWFDTGYISSVSLTKNFHVKVDLRSSGLACIFVRVVRIKMRTTQALFCTPLAATASGCRHATITRMINSEFTFYDCKPTTCQVARPSPQEMWAHDTRNDWTLHDQVLCFEEAGQLHSGSPRISCFAA